MCSARLTDQLSPRVTQYLSTSHPALKSSCPSFQWRGVVSAAPPPRCRCLHSLPRLGNPTWCDLRFAPLCCSPSIRVAWALTRQRSASLLPSSFLLGPLLLSLLLPLLCPTIAFQSQFYVIKTSTCNNSEKPFS